jgi:adenine-specific DNA-methyltransferase
MTAEKLNKFSKPQLIELIKELQKKQEYGLVWDDETIHEKVVSDCLNNQPLIKEIKSKNIIGDKKAHHHLLIEGDNFHALTVLKETHKSCIDLIYIDPPYNTGKKNDFMYNDHFVDADDKYRHSKWLSFMYKRLQLAKDLLKNTGAIFISIDDNEIAQLKLLCNRIFGEENFVAQFIRKNKTGAGHDSGQIAVEFDYMLCFAKQKSKLIFQKETLDVENDEKYKLADEHVDFRGKYYLRDLDYKGTYGESLDYGIETPDGKIIFSGDKKGRPNTWRWSIDKLKWGIKNDYIVFKKTKDKWKVYIKQYQFTDNENKKRIRQLPHRAIIQFLNGEGSQELNSILGQNIFRFPKSTALISFCINLFEDKNITVLDFFAGSGTTGHAVLKLNAEDRGERKFILCTNNENDICEKVTYPRLKKVINGYSSGTKNVKGCGGNLKFYRTAFKK